ncbi:hypothetical protein [Nitrosospira sp. Nsp14]|uniref:hypothetical protein n=1 Tax=Nitrosospira sp. Nsp14 TaxID=1855333 RepID=UPI0011603B32|nr:hypothetical protein [Nitrosospira sp. Nsp14]
MSPNPDEESTHEIPSNIFRVPGSLGEMRVGISFCKHCWRDSSASPTLNYQPAWAESGQRHYRAASGTGGNGRSLHRAADAGRSHRLYSARAAYQRIKDYTTATSTPTFTFTFTWAGSCRLYGY